MMQQPWRKTSANVHMPPIIYGTAWKKERTADLVELAVLSGFKGIDTACQPKHYAEALVGQALSRLKEHGVRRNALFLQTKFTPLAGQDPMQVPYDPLAPAAMQVAQSFDTSLKNLKTEYIDSFLLHSVITPHTLLMQVWRAMERIQKSGGARQLGISNCYDVAILKDLYRDADVKPAVLQNRFYQETGYDARLRRWCAHHDIIYQSFWTLTANPHILASPTMDALTLSYHKTAAQVFFRYLFQSGIVPLTGTCSQQHMKEDLSIFDFELSAEDMLRIGLLLTPAW